MKRHKLAVAAMAAVAVLFLVALPSSEAASATSSTVYLVNGRELPVGFDPIVLKSGMLLPEAVLSEFGVTISESTDGTVVLKRATRSMSLRVGSKSASISGTGLLLNSAPIRLSGQLYIPDDALALLGVHATNESGLLFLNSWPMVEGYTDLARYNAALGGEVQEATISPARDTYVRVQVVRLKEQIVMGSPWTTDPATRGYALDLLKSAQLFQVTVTNTSDSVWVSAPSDYFLVDDLGNQYPLSDERLSLMGDLFATVAPGAKVSGVLVFPVAQDGARSFTLYLQTPNGLKTIGAYTKY